MNLETWLKKQNMKSITFSRKFKMTLNCIYNSVSGEARISPQLAEKIEEVTGGEVTRYEAIWKDYKAGDLFKDKKFISNTARSEKNMKKLTYAEYGLYSVALKKEVTSVEEFYEAFSDLEPNVNIVINSLVLKGFLFEKEES